MDEVSAVLPPVCCQTQASVPGHEEKCKPPFGEMGFTWVILGCICAVIVTAVIVGLPWPAPGEHRAAIKDYNNMLINEVRVFSFAMFDRQKLVPPCPRCS